MFVSRSGISALSCFLFRSVRVFFCAPSGFTDRWLKGRTVGRRRNRRGGAAVIPPPATRWPVGGV